MTDGTESAVGRYGQVKHGVQEVLGGVVSNAIEHREWVADLPSLLRYS